MNSHHGETSGGLPDAKQWSVRKTERAEAPHWIGPLLMAEDVLQYLVALALVAVAGVVLAHAATEAFRTGRRFSEEIPTVINTVLFVVIVLELFGTVVSHFRSGGFQLRPFLIIGIISGVRHILTVGAQSTFGGSTLQSNTEFNHTMIEFGVNVAIVVGLVVALILIHRFNADNQD